MHSDVSTPVNTWLRESTGWTIPAKVRGQWLTGTPLPLQPVAAGSR
jgi:hypothetical protein